LAAAGATLNEHESKTLLADWGLSGPREAACRTLDEALAAASSITYPVVLKILSPDIAHKTEVGGVALNIATPEQLRTAHAQMMASVARQAPQARIEGVLVGEMVTGGLELAVGLHRDPEFGLAIMLGAGGTLIEFVADAQFALPPLGREDAARLIGRLRTAKLLDGIRGGTKLDRAALIDALVAVSRVATTLGDDIEAMDINPLLVLPEGRGVRVLDAVIMKRRQDQ
jgi:succinyl-CoA synthetase beta subunit